MASRHARVAESMSGPTSKTRKTLARDTGEEHRAATPLELLYDLVFVVAIAQAAAALHHSISGGHVVESIVGYLRVCRRRLQVRAICW